MTPSNDQRKQRHRHRRELTLQIARELIDSVGRRDRTSAMLCGVAAASQALLLERKLEDAFATAVEILVYASGVDTATIVRHRTDEDGVSRWRRVAYASASNIDDRMFRDLREFEPTRDHMELWHERLMAGETVHVAQMELPPELRAGMDEIGIRDALLVPVTVNDETWGTVGFSDFSSENPWDRGERCVLAAMAVALGFAITRDLDETRIVELRQGLMLFHEQMSVAMFARSAAHDINNLLTVISTLAGRDEVVEEAVRQAHELCTRLMSITRKKPGLHREPCSVSEIASDVCDLLEPQRPRGVTLHQDELDPEVPTIMADRVQLGQLIMNLLLNAFEALGDDRGDVWLRCYEVTVGADGDAGPPDLPAGDYVCLEVEDSGPGIPARVRDQIFEPLYSTKQGGHGLGLATVRKIVDDHGGSIDLRNPSHRGSMFAVYFPIAPQPR